MPSASALKLRIILCLKTGTETFFTSSISGVPFPDRRDWAFAAKIKKELALGPAPQSIYLFVSLWEDLEGLVLWTKLTAYSITLSETGTFLTRSW